MIILISINTTLIIFIDINIHTYRCILKYDESLIIFAGRSYISSSSMHDSSIYLVHIVLCREVGGWGRDPKKCTGRDWGMGSSTI